MGMCDEWAPYRQAPLTLQTPCGKGLGWRKPRAKTFKSEGRGHSCQGLKGVLRLALPFTRWCLIQLKIYFYYFPYENNYLAPLN